jgi:uracil-DNA glycosylase
VRASAACFATPQQAHIHQRYDVAARRVLRTLGQDRPFRRGQFALEPGVPFTGPAGKLFDAEADAAGLDRASAYVTNAVKHFKFLPRGKKRLHQRPDAGEVIACRWWLDHERALVRPRLILAMGATALASLTGTGKGILTRRGRVEAAPDGTPVFVTVHPSYILRLPDASVQASERLRFRNDLIAVAGLLRQMPGV